MSLVYPGSELELFAQAANWKRYWAGFVRRYLGRRVLEVGAGIGSNIPLLFSPPIEQWIALEPDVELARQIARGIAIGAIPTRTEVRICTCQDLDSPERFDTVLYIDVLEHIQDDRAELDRAAALLNPGGNLVVLAPAHQYLFSRFDASIGHYRRYSRMTLNTISPAGLTLSTIHGLDSVGLLASLANRLLLRQSMPSARQIATWDRYMVPISQRLDPCLLHLFGRTILAVWSRT